MKTHSPQPFHGILSVEDVDLQGEVLELAGADITKLPRSGLCAHPSLCQPLVGIVQRARVILRLDDCETDQDRALWDVAAGKPFLKIAGLLFDSDIGLPAYRWMTLSPRTVFLAACGYILKRAGNRLTKTVITSAYLTPSPVYRANRFFLG